MSSRRLRRKRVEVQSGERDKIEYPLDFQQETDECKGKAAKKSLEEFMISHPKINKFGVTANIITLCFDRAAPKLELF